MLGHVLIESAYDNNTEFKTRSDNEDRQQCSSSNDVGFADGPVGFSVGGAAGG
jgi:hypothetical protein